MLESVKSWWGGKKPEAATERKWIGSVKQEVALEKGQVTYVFSLYVDSVGKRYVVPAGGPSPESVPIYHTHLKPWLETGDKTLLLGKLVTYDKEYWADVMGQAVETKPLAVHAKKTKKKLTKE